MRLGRTTEAWLAAGQELRARVEEVLDDLSPEVEVIGSSSVLGLVAKPIIDLAVGLTGDRPASTIVPRLEADGWIYRGDAGAHGGHVLVLEARPWHRVAHLHLVEHDGDAWQDYVRFRDLLRRSPEARQRYEAVKVALVGQGVVGRKEYTRAKTEVVRSLLHTAD